MGRYHSAPLVGLMLMVLCAHSLAEWHSLGPGGGGWLWSLAVAPDEKGTIYLGCDVGGIYRSDDFGRSWRIINAGLGNTYVAAIAVDPSNPSVVYAGTHGGVYKSTDKGEHWALKRNGFPPIETWGITAPIAALAVDPSDERHILAGIGEPRRRTLPKTAKTAGIFVSYDGAESWHHIDSPAELASAQVYSIVFSPDRPKLILAATTAGVFRSDDGGRSWESSSLGLPDCPVMEIAADAQPGLFYVTFYDDEAKTGGVAKSTDWGHTWKVIRSAEGRDFQYWRIVTDPRTLGTVYASLRHGKGIFKSTDGGKRWRRITRDDNVRSAWFYRGFTCTALAIDPLRPDRLYYANDMEIYGTTDGGETWEQLCTDLVRPPSPRELALWRGRGVETTCSSSAAVAREYPQLLYFGYWDTGLWRSTDGGRTWAWVTQWMGYGKAAAVVIDPERPWRAWMSFGRNYGPHRIWRTDDYGRDWHLVGYEDTGLPTGAIFCIVLDPTGPTDRRVLYVPVVGKGIYKSEDGGLSWRRVDVNLGENLAFTNMALDPSDPRRLWLGVRYSRKGSKLVPGGVFLSEDGGVHWRRIADIPERPRVFPAPSDPRIVYVAERDYSSVGRGGVYKSADGGKSWRMPVERLDAGIGNLARTYIAAITVDPHDADVVYAASVDEGYDISCGKGVFVSRDGGNAWKAMNEGLTKLNVHNLIVDPNDPRRLYAGTGGNGFFRWGSAPPVKPLPDPPPQSPIRPDIECNTTTGWSTNAEIKEITGFTEQLWWGRGYILIRIDGEPHTLLVRKELQHPLDISSAKLVAIRMRGRNADGTALVIARVNLYDLHGRRLVYEKDIRLPTTWTLAELPLSDWAADKAFNFKAVKSVEFHIWAPYAQAKPCELAIGYIAFRDVR